MSNSNHNRADITEYTDAELYIRVMNEEPLYAIRRDPGALLESLRRRYVFNIPQAQFLWEALADEEEGVLF